MVDKKAISFNIYMILWLLYNIHWHKTGFSSFIESVSNLILVIIICVSIYYFWYAHAKMKLPRIFQSLDFLIALFTVYGLISILTGEPIYLHGNRINNGSYLIGPLRSFLPVYTFYVWTQKGVLTEKRIKMWGGILLAQFLYFYFNSTRVQSWGVGTFTSGRGYLFASLLPFVFLFKKKKLFSFVLLGFLLLMIFWSMKRGAIVTAIIFTLFFAWKMVRGMRAAIQKVGIMIMVAVFLLIGSWYVLRFYESSSYMQRRFDQTSEGGSSGRDELASNIWNQFTKESNVFQMLFGYGADGTLKIGENYAHNDWLEMLADTGIVGVLVYFAFWLSLIRCWRRARRIGYMDGELLGVLLVMFPRTLFSMLYSNMEVPISLFLAYCIASLYQNYSSQQMVVSNRSNLSIQDRQ